MNSRARFEYCTNKTASDRISRKNFKAIKLRVKDKKFPDDKPKDF